MQTAVAYTARQLANVEGRIGLVYEDDLPVGSHREINASSHAEAEGRRPQADAGRPPSERELG